MAGGSPIQDSKITSPPPRKKFTPSPQFHLHPPMFFFQKDGGRRPPFSGADEFWSVPASTLHLINHHPLILMNFATEVIFCSKKFACGSHLYGNFFLFIFKTIFISDQKRGLLSKYLNSSSANTSSFSFNISWKNSLII